jgi:ABC-type multidrug transport system fused ATPase/permease subunit
VGPSGAGKSTLISLLLRLYDTTAGSVLLDGVDIRNVRQRDYLNLCAIVMQEPFLFVDTVANNIRAARPDATMEEVIEAAKAANIHDEIMAMENGYETVLGRAELARGVSTGQKQRICIAAALLKNAPLLFLDEATSNLDSVSERHLQVAIDRLMQGRTTFVIAHRLSTLRSADRILVIDDGGMVGIGKHEELLATCSTYRRLWQFQSMARDDRQPHIALSEDDVAVETLTPSAAAK